MKAFITGGHGDIGSAIVDIFKKYNYEVYSPSSNEMNLSSDQSIKEYLLANIKDIDVFIHCAGVNKPQKFETLTEENIMNTMNINTFSSINILKHILPIMKNKKYGRIVLVSSLWSQYAKTGRIAYAMSKSSLDSLSRGLAVEYGEYNILINSVLPGFINTKLTKKNLPEKVILDITRNTPLGKLGKVDDIAEITYFLSSKSNNFITGQSIKVDGGYTL